MYQTPRQLVGVKNEDVKRNKNGKYRIKRTYKREFI